MDLDVLGGPAEVGVLIKPQPKLQGQKYQITPDDDEATVPLLRPSPGPIDEGLQERWHKFKPQETKLSAPPRSIEAETYDNAETSEKARKENKDR